ncbi:MAG: transglycosylase [Brevundimonas sp.]|nr:MAG: transglycosylase [Brevundimonas sp.]
MQYADIAAAVLGSFVLAWLADLFTGRRGLFATSLVSGVAAVAGWFLAIRVFGVSTMDEWTWVVWSLAASALALVGFFLFRSKR